MKNNIKLASLIPSILLTGCASNHVQSTGEIEDTTEKKMDEFSELINKKIEESQIGEIIQDYYVDTTPRRTLKRETNYPVEFYEDLEVNTSNFNLGDFVSNIYAKSGIMIRFNLNDLKNFTSDEEESLMEDESDQTPLGSVPNDDESSSDSINEIRDANIKISDVILKDVNFNGNIKNFMDYVSIKTSLNWNFDPITKEVFFYKYNEETFDLRISKSHISKKNSITTKNKSVSESEDGSDDSSTENTIIQKEENESWTEAMDVIKQIVGEDGTVVGYKSQKKVMVKSTDLVLSKVRRFIDGINETATTQVGLRVDISNVTIEDTDSIDLNINYVNTVIADKVFGLNQGLSLVGTAAGGFSFSGGNNSYGEPVTPAKSVDISGEILNKFGTVNRSTKEEFVIKNNTTYSMQVTQNTTYVSKIERETDDDGNETISEEIDIVSDGITYTFSPSVVGNSIALDLTTHLNNLDEMRPSSTGSGSELPTTSRKSIKQETELKDGIPKVVSIIELDTTRTTKSAPFFNDLYFLFGGTKSHAKRKEYLVVTVTGYKQK